MTGIDHENQCRTKQPVEDKRRGTGSGEVKGKKKAPTADVVVHYAQGSTVGHTISVVVVVDCRLWGLYFYIKKPRRKIVTLFILTNRQ